MSEKTALNIAMEYSLQGCCSIIETVLLNKAHGLVYYGVQDMCSSHFGVRKLVVYGPGCTIPDLETAKINKLDVELASTTKWFDYAIIIGDTDAARTAFCTELLLHAVRAVARNPRILLHGSLEDCVEAVCSGVDIGPNDVEHWLRVLKDTAWPKGLAAKIKDMYVSAEAAWARIKAES